MSLFSAPCCYASQESPFNIHHTAVLQRMAYAAIVCFSFMCAILYTYIMHLCIYLGQSEILLHWEVEIAHTLWVFSVNYEVNISI